MLNHADYLGQMRDLGKGAAEAQHSKRDQSLVQFRFECARKITRMFQGDDRAALLAAFDAAYREESRLYLSPAI